MANRYGYSTAALFSKFTIHRKALCSSRMNTFKMLRYSHRKTGLSLNIHLPSLPQHIYIYSTWISQYDLEVTRSEWHCYDNGAQGGLHAGGMAFVTKLQAILQEHRFLENCAFCKWSRLPRCQASCPVQQMDIIQVARSPCRSIKHADYGLSDSLKQPKSCCPSCTPHEGKYQKRVIFSVPCL